MSTLDSFSDPARRFLQELEDALAGVPAEVRSEILVEISGELAGLDAPDARARIAELGDPRAIAADAAAAGQVPPTDAPPVHTPLVQPSPALAPVSKTYATATAIVLTAGWYVVPVIGWIVGLVMIGVGSRWAPQKRVAAIVVSVVAAAIATGALLVLRGTDGWLLGLAVFLILPLGANILVSSYLRREWATPTPI